LHDASASLNLMPYLLKVIHLEQQFHFLRLFTCYNNKYIEMSKQLMHSACAT